MLRFSAHKIEKTTCLKTILYGLKWIVTGSTYISKNVSNGFHSYASISRSVDLPFWAINKAKSSLKAFDSYLNSFFINHNAGIYTSNIIHNRYHSFSLFPDPIDLRYGRKIDRKSKVFVKSGGQR